MTKKTEPFENLPEARVVVRTMLSDFSSFKADFTARLEALEGGVALESPVIDREELEARVVELASGLVADLQENLDAMIDGRMRDNLAEAVNGALASKETPLSWDAGVEMLRGGSYELSSQAFDAMNVHLAKRHHALEVTELGTVSVAAKEEVVQANDNTSQFRLLIHSEPFEGSQPDAEGQHIRLLQPGEVFNG